MYFMGNGFIQHQNHQAVDHEHFIFFKIPDQLYDAAYTQVIREATPEILGNDSD